MRKLLFFIVPFFLLALIFAPLTQALTPLYEIPQKDLIALPTSTPTPTPTPTVAIKLAPRIKGTFSVVTGTATNTPVPTVNPAGATTPTTDSQVVGETVTAIPTEPELIGVSDEKGEKEEEKKLDQKEIIGVILIGILIVIIIIQALWDKIKKPPTATSSDPE